MRTKIFFLILFFLSLNSFSFSSERIAFIDIDLLIKETEAGKLMMKKFNERNLKDSKTLNLKKKTLIEKEKKIETLKNIISQDELQSKLVEFKNEIDLYNDQKDQFIKSFDEYKNNEYKLFFDNINKVIQQYMTRNSISILLDKKNIFIGESKHDITSDIIQILNKN